MSMTVARLHKLLGALIEKGHGRKPVCVNAGSFRHRMEDEASVIMDVQSVVGPEFIYKTDDDDDIKINADGSEAGRFTVIIT